MVDGIKERFASIRKETGQNVKDFAFSLNMEPTTVSSIESGTREPSKGVLLKLRSEYDVNLHWMFTGEGEMFLQKQGKSLEKTSATGQAYKIPLLHQKVSCGEGANWEEEQNIKGYIDVFSLIPRLKLGRLFAFSAQGNSMVGAGIRSGDYVLFDTSLSPQYKDDLYVFSLDGEVYCKQLEFDQISRKVKIYSIRVADLEKAELLTTLNIDDSDFPDRFHIFGRVDSWVHPNLEE